MKTKISFTLLFLLSCLYNLSAQDTLFKRNGKFIVAKVIEVSPDIVKYTFPEKKDSLVIGIDKDDLKKIVFASGMVQWIVPDLTNPEHYTDQKKNDLKLDFLAPVLNHLTFTYEKSVKPGSSWETSITCVGPGFEDTWNHAGGIILGGGMKFIKTPDYYQPGMRYSHILKGSYIRLQGYLGYYEESRLAYQYSNYYPYTSTSTKVVDKYTVGALQVQFGRQWVLGDHLVFDLFSGVGYGFASVVTSPSVSTPYYDFYTKTYHYTFQKISTTPLSLSGGLRLGFLF